MNILKREQLRN